MVEAAAARFDEALVLAEQGRLGDADTVLRSIDHASDVRLGAQIANATGAIAAAQGNHQAAERCFREALAIDPQCRDATENLDVLSRSIARASNGIPTGSDGNHTSDARSHPTKIAILSLLFNWPSTGGGIVHTAELADFLARAGFEVQHICAQHEAWGIGPLRETPPVPPLVLEFDERSWSRTEIVNQFRQALDRFNPDHVIITDSWNFKPWLAEAAAGYRYHLRLAALECLCPLNNVRLLPTADGSASQCPRHQLATPEQCHGCVGRNKQLSGALHEAERRLSDVGSPHYDKMLRRAFAEAEAVLVVNPLIEALVEPFCKSVKVIPSGFDRSRFEDVCAKQQPADRHRARLFFAGLADEYMKGCHVLLAACDELWSRRQDFELRLTSDAPGSGARPYAEYLGWLSQRDLPHQMGDSDVLIFPTIAQEALGRSAVEAMGVGLPVIASRIGGLQFVVNDGANGLLFRAGDPHDLARKIEILLDHPELRGRMGAEGRRRFEDSFTWDAIIEQHYRPLFKARHGELVST